MRWRARERDIDSQEAGRKGALGTLVVLGAIWGSSYLFIEVALDDLRPGIVAWGRQLLSALVLLAVAAVAGGLGALRGRGLRVAVLAVVMIAGPTLLLPVGQQWLTASLAAVLVATTPMLTALLVAATLRERLRGGAALGLAVGLAGVVLVVGLDVTGDPDELLGAACVLLASLGWASGGVLVARWFGDVPPVALVAAVSGIGAVLLTPVAAASLGGPAPGAGSIAALVALGVVGTGAGWAIFYRLVARAGPARAALANYLAPGFAVLYGAALLGEAPTAGVVAGLVLIVSGSVLAAWSTPEAAGEAPGP